MATIDELRVVKVSGDQSAPVLGQGIASTPTPAGGLSLQTIPAGAYTPEPLVGRVEPTEQARGTSGTGPSGLVVPVGTLVHWDLPAEAGRLLAATTATDDSAYVINRWAPGTKAGTYTVKAQRITSTGDIVTDATWQVVVEPGAVRYVNMLPPTELPEHIKRPTEGDTIDVGAILKNGEDEHRNAIPPAAVVASGTPTWELVIPATGDGKRQNEVIATGEGWRVVVPEARPDDGRTGAAYHYYFTLGEARFTLYLQNIQHPATSEP